MDNTEPHEHADVKIDMKYSAFRTYPVARAGFSVFTYQCKTKKRVVSYKEWVALECREHGEWLRHVGCDESAVEVSVESLRDALMTALSK